MDCMSYVPLKHLKLKIVELNIVLTQTADDGRCMLVFLAHLSLPLLHLNVQNLAHLVDMTVTWGPHLFISRSSLFSRRLSSRLISSCERSDEERDGKKPKKTLSSSFSSRVFIFFLSFFKQVKQEQYLSNVISLIVHYSQFKRIVRESPSNFHHIALGDPLGLKK